MLLDGVLHVSANICFGNMEDYIFDMAPGMGEIRALKVMMTSFKVFHKV